MNNEFINILTSIRINKELELNDMNNNKKRFLYYLGKFNLTILKSIEKYDSSPINNPIEIIYKGNARTFLKLERYNLLTFFDLFPLLSMILKK